MLKLLYQYILVDSSPSAANPCLSLGGEVQPTALGTLGERGRRGETIFTLTPGNIPPEQKFGTTKYKFAFVRVSGGYEPVVSLDDCAPLEVRVKDSIIRLEAVYFNIPVHAQRMGKHGSNVDAVILMKPAAGAKVTRTWFDDPFVVASCEAAAVGKPNVPPDGPTDEVNGTGLVDSTVQTLTADLSIIYSGTPYKFWQWAMRDLSADLPPPPLSPGALPKPYGNVLLTNDAYFTALAQYTVDGKSPYKRKAPRRH